MSQRVYSPFHHFAFYFHPLLGINECESPSVHKCAQLCTDTPTGYYCSCHAGYQLMPDGKACEDVNECLTMPAACSQICENAAGSYHCKCAPGYIREGDGRTCRQNSGVDPYLLYTNRYYIRKMAPDGSQMSVFLQGLDSVVALDFDDSEERLYWLDEGTRKIERMHFDGTGRETLVDELGAAEGMAVDWVGRYVEGKEKERKLLFYLLKTLTPLSNSEFMTFLFKRTESLQQTRLSLLQEVVLVGFLLRLNPRDGAGWPLPEEAAVRRVHRRKYNLLHEPSSSCGRQP